MKEQKRIQLNVAGSRYHCLTVTVNGHFVVSKLAGTQHWTDL